MSNKTLEETESALWQCAEDRSTWEMTTEDAVMIRQMERIGAEFVCELFGGARRYKLRADQVVLRRGKKQMTAAQLETSRRNAEKMRADPRLSGVAATQNARSDAFDVGESAQRRNQGVTSAAEPQNAIAETEAAP